MLLLNSLTAYFGNTNKILQYLLYWISWGEKSLSQAFLEKKLFPRQMPQKYIFGPPPPPNGTKHAAPYAFEGGGGEGEKRVNDTVNLYLC